MTNYKWKRCQECGGKAAQSDNLYDNVAGETKAVGTRCLRCDATGSTTYWDKEQASTRARKRFELVKHFVGSVHCIGTKDAIELADSALTELYGPVPDELGDV